MVEFFNEAVEFPEINIEQTENWIIDTIQLEGKLCGDINIIFCSDDYLLEINQNYLQHDYYTDVITFDYSEAGFISGDIFISLETVADNAKQYQIPLVHELHRIIIHGVLHLVGYQDKTETLKQIMTSKEDVYLSKIQL